MNAMAIAAPALPVTGPSRISVVSMCWREARPVVQWMFQLRFLSAVMVCVTVGGGRLDHRVVFGAIAWLAATWTIYLLNGVSDVVADQQNGSTRPIASHCLSPSAAGRFCVFLGACSLFCAGLVSPVMVLLVAALLALGWRYSMGTRPAKNTVGGFVAVVVAGGLLTYLAGWQAAGGQLPSGLPAFGLAMALWMGVAGATKDLGDVAGDRLAGRRTLPVVVGERAARWVIAATTALLGGGFLAVAVHTGAALTAPAAVVALGCTVLIGLLLAPAGQRRGLRRPYQTFMLTQYAAHLTLLLQIIY